MFCSNAGCGTHREILGLETVSYYLCHLVVNANFLFGIRNRDDEREGLRLESLLVLDAVARQQVDGGLIDARRQHLLGAALQ